MVTEYEFFRASARDAGAEEAAAAASVAGLSTPRGLERVCRKDWAHVEERRRLHPLPALWCGVVWCGMVVSCEVVGLSRVQLFLRVGSRGAFVPLLWLRFTSVVGGGRVRREARGVSLALSERSC